MTTKINRGYRRAKRRYWRRAWLAEKLDTFMTWGAGFLRMCGEGRRNNRSVLVAQLFYTQCPCCLFFRGVTFGAFLVAAPGFAVWLLSLIL